MAKKKAVAEITVVRKLIDLDSDVKKALTLKAVEADTNLKSYIEGLCIADSKKK